MIKPRFSDDNPKSNPWTEDRLGFAPFSRRLSASILEIEAPNGYVIGLQGAWGSGKSTVLNFVQAYLEKHNSELSDGAKKITVIDFMPWIVSGHRDLIESFFKIATEQLATNKDAWARRGKTTLRSLKKNLDPLVDATASIGAILAPGVGPAGIKIATELAKKAGASKLEEWLAEPSLQSAYDKLKAQILEQDERFLVVIDDIDRLTEDEIREMMQMVKTIGRLPHVIYLLAYDRNIVWPSLNKMHKLQDSGPNFAEKIIQQEVDLPKPSRSALLGMLDAEIGFLTADTPQNERWYSIVTHGVYHWIKYPRDVARLSNAVKFTWPAIENEVDPQDILAIEGIRLFEPSLFEWIRNNRDNMFGTNNWTMSSEEGRKKLCDNFLKTIPEKEHDRIVRLITSILPTISQIFEKRSFYGLGHEQHYKVVNRRGIGCEAGFDSYFSLHPAANAIPRQIIKTALDKKTTIEMQNGIIQGFVGRKTENNKTLLSEYFISIRYFLNEFPKTEIPQSLFIALFKCGGEIQGVIEHTSGFVLSSLSNLEFLLGDMCKFTEPSNVKNILTEIYGTDVSLSFGSSFWAQRASELGFGDREKNPENALIDESFLRELHSKLIVRIEQAIGDGSIVNSPYFGDIIQVLSFERGHEHIKNWISGLAIESGSFLAKICHGLLGYTVGSNPRRYSMHQAPDNKYYDIKALHRAAIRHCKDENLSQDEINRITTLKDALSRMIGQNNADELEV